VLKPQQESYSPPNVSARDRFFSSLLEALLMAGSFATQAKELRLYRSIATMDRKAPLPRLPDQTPSWDSAAALARTWGLNQLADRLGALATKADAHSR
jgi:DNA polymerase I